MAEEESPAGPATLGALFERFVQLDPKNTQAIKYDQFNTLSTEFSFSGESVDPSSHFANGFIYFNEVCKIAGVLPGELPISINYIATAFRKLAGEGTTVHFLAFSRALAYYFEADLNPEDTEVSFEVAVQKVAGPKKGYKLNIYKDAFRRFGRDGDGTMKNSELKELARFSEVAVDTDAASVTMNELLPLVVPDSNHPIFTLKINMNEVRKAFDWCDLDHTGKLNTKEFAKALRLAGQNPSQYEVKKIQAEFDQDKDGEFDFHEFTDIVARGFLSTDEMREKAQRAFAVFDTDGSGFITLDELRRIMTTYGEDMSEDEVDRLFKELDTDADGKLDINEFVELLLK